MEALAGCLSFLAVALQGGKCLSMSLANDRIRTNTHANLFCPCWEADPPHLELGLVLLLKSWYELLVSVARGLHSVLDKCGLANCWCGLPLPPLNSVVLRKVGQSSQPAAIRQRVEHRHLRMGRFLLHRCNSKFWTDYAGSECCQGLSLYSSGKRKRCSFPKPDTVAQFCRPEVFW